MMYDQEPAERFSSSESEINPEEFNEHIVGGSRLRRRSTYVLKSKMAILSRTINFR